MAGIEQRAGKPAGAGCSAQEEDRKIQSIERHKKVKILLVILMALIVDWFLALRHDEELSHAEADQELYWEIEEDEFDGIDGEGMLLSQLIKEHCHE